MDRRRRKPDVRKGLNSYYSSKSPSPASPHDSPNVNRPDEAYRHSGHAIPVNAGGLMHSLSVTSVAGLQKQSDSKPVAKDLNQHDCQFSNVKNFTHDLGDLKLAHDSPVETDTHELLDSSSSSMKRDFPLPSATRNAKEKSLNVLGAERKQKGYTVDESYINHTNSSCFVDSASIGDSSQTTDFSIKNRLLKEEIQFEKNFQEKTGLVDQSGNSHYVYDICPPRTGPTVRLKAPLHVKNREIRNLNKRTKEEGNILVLRPGMILLRSYISFIDQVKLVRTCRELGMGSGGFYQPGYSDGAKLNLKMMCLGKHWDPMTSAYGDERPSDGAKPPPIPDAFFQLVTSAIVDSHAHLKKQGRKGNVNDILPPMSPNICIINFYTKSDRLGLHQDKDESKDSLCRGLPVVSFSIGESAEFVYSDQRDVLNVEKIRLESGDVLIFGGQARHIYHGVTTIYSDTAPGALLEETNLRPGRLNLTFREY